MCEVGPVAVAAASETGEVRKKGRDEGRRGRRGQREEGARTAAGRKLGSREKMTGATGEATGSSWMRTVMTEGLHT